MPGTGLVVRDGSEVLVPVARNDSIGFAQLRFPVSNGPGLFGNRADLLADWRKRLGILQEQPGSPALSAEPESGVIPESID